MNFKTIMEYSPFDNKRLSPFDTENPIEDFYEYYFVDYADFANQLESDIFTKIENNTNTIIFFGASGTGKTTFLHHFSRKYHDKYHFHFLNLIEKPSLVDYQDCIRTMLLDKLYNVFNGQNETVSKRLYEIYVKNHKAVPMKSKTDNDCLISYLIANAIEETNVVDYFCKISNNQNLLILCIIALLLSNIDEPAKKNVFIFDNLDEIPTEYISEQINDVIQSAYSAAQDYCEKYLNYKFLKNCTFILSFRTTNAHLVDKTQLQERQKLSCDEIEFGINCQVPYPSILQKRINYYKSKEQDEAKKSFVDSFCQLINSEKQYCSNTLKPLYNYDFRMFTHYFILKLLEQTDVSISKLFYETDQEGKKKEYIQLGSRGILLFNALSGMLKDDSSRFYTYVKHEFAKDSICNLYRMSFTLLSNLGDWADKNQTVQQDLKEESDFNKETKKILLYDFVKRIEAWYGPEYVKMALDGLIGNTAYNFEYPITLIGSSIDNFTNSSKLGHSNSALAKFIVEMYESHKSSFANIKVKIHPLCVVYSDRVFIHFEYFNLISNQWGNPVVADYKYDEPIPLFMITNDYMLKACLKSVFETVKKILKCADSHFCKHCRASKTDTCLQTIDDEGQHSIVISSIESCNKSVNKFIDDGFCFNKTLYATRVITSHINYLDKYRAYIWNTKQHNKEQQKSWQILLLNQISEYIDFWNNRDVKDNEHLWITKYKKSLEKSLTDMDKNVYSPIILN